MKRLLLLMFASFFITTVAFATININTASTSELEMLNGIGPSRAKAIIEHRQQHGAFNSTEEIKNVPGIKDGLYNKIKDDIAITGVNTPPAKKEGVMTKTKRAVHKAAAKTKEKTAGVVKHSADSIEKGVHSLKKKSAHSEAEAAQHEHY